MSTNSDNDGQTVKTQNQKGDESMETDFGTRNLHKMRFSKAVIIPKIALTNCGHIEANMVHVRLIQEKGQRYLRLDPIYKPKEEGKN